MNNQKIYQIIFFFLIYLFSGYALANLPIATTQATVSSGIRHALLVRPDGSLWGAGTSSYGELGSTSDSPFWSKLITSNIKAVYAQGYHSFVLNNDNSLLYSGRNSSGLSGKGGTSQINSFVPVATNVAKVVVNNDHALMLKLDGSVWFAGGGGNMASTSNVWIQIDTGAVDIATSYSAIYVLKENGYLYGRGQNSTGEMGQGDYNTATLWRLLATDATQIAAASGSLFYINTSNELKAAGQNSYDQLANGNTQSQATFITVQTNVNNIQADSETTVIQFNDNTRKIVGRNYAGLMGVGSSAAYIVSPQNVPDFVSVYAGSSVSIAVKSDGSYWGAGLGNYSQLGDATYSHTNAWKELVVLGVPQAINDLFATQGTVFNQVDLTWGEVLDAEQYNLYRSNTLGSLGDLIATLNSPISSYSDTTVDGATHYFYSIQPKNRQHTGDFPLN